MKSRIVAVVVILTVLCEAAYALRMVWKNTDQPPVSLHLALSLAEEELAKEDVKYFCIGASLAKTFSEGDWALHFSSKEGKEMWVNVASDKKITKSKEGFEY